MSVREREISISFRSQPSEAILIKEAQATARYNFDAVSVYEDLGDPTPIYPLLTFAKASQDPTRSTRYGPAGFVVPKYATMEPLVGDICRLESIFPGRCYMGFVPGAWMDKVGLKSATVDQMREAIMSSQYLLSGSTDGLSGQFYSVAAGFSVNYPLPKQRIPILMGVWGERMASLAGEIADEVKIGGTVNPGMVSVLRERLKKGTTAAKRDLNDIGIVLGAVTVVDEDGQKAFAYAKQKAIGYIEAIGDKDPTVMRDFPDEVRRIQSAVRAGDFETALRNLPDLLARKFVLAGTPHQVIRQVEDIFNSGATRVEFGTPHGLDEIVGIDLLGQKVLPYFKGVS